MSILELDRSKMKDERSRNFAFSRNIHEFFNPLNHFTESSVKWQLQHKNRYFFKNLWF